MSEINLRIQGTQDITITHEDAVKYVINFLRSPRPSSYGSYGYDLYLGSVLLHYCKEYFRLESYDAAKPVKELSPLFMDACWELCRRGILRPSTRDIGGQGGQDGGYSITAFGRQWLDESDLDDYVPTEPDRFAQMLQQYKGILGSAFHERAQEAVRCYNAHAYLACCVMAGSAAEAVLMAIANKVGAEFKPREKIEKIRATIISKSEAGVQENLIAFSDIVKYWRDEGVHHENWETSANKAYIALAMLLRLAMYAKEKWLH